MAESPTAVPGTTPGESPAQAKARLRRERLAAKSGASRLQQITALQGGPPKDISEFLKDVPGTRSVLCLDSRLSASKSSPRLPRLERQRPTPKRSTYPSTTTPLLRNRACLRRLLSRAIRRARLAQPRRQMPLRIP